MKKLIKFILSLLIVIAFNSCGSYIFVANGQLSTPYRYYYYENGVYTYNLNPPPAVIIYHKPAPKAKVIKRVDPPKPKRK